MRTPHVVGLVALAAGPWWPEFPAPSGRYRVTTAHLCPTCDRRGGWCGHSPLRARLVHPDRHASSSNAATTKHLPCLDRGLPLPALQYCTNCSPTPGRPAAVILALEYRDDEAIATFRKRWQRNHGCPAADNCRGVLILAVVSSCEHTQNALEQNYFSISQFTFLVVYFQHTWELLGNIASMSCRTCHCVIYYGFTISVTWLSSLAHCLVSLLALMTTTKLKATSQP
ncbi:hypothetical protein BD289DRAFT_19847 [Coniella lustricola]|uniref:Uncharacterized protein n=1 Tax=Coniella lustricola TaxID=2025994 RepID=A0A2T3AJG7_9PEZI|nr:hypothetical protein BD289DRAFT_19847 [Coniella lustricola]